MTAAPTDFQGMDAYQAEAEKTSIYRDASDLNWIRVFYASLGLAGEAGEVANKVKKVLRDDGAEVTPGRREAILDEAGDCLWYVAMLAAELDMPLSVLAARNINKLQERHGR